MDLGQRLRKYKLRADVTLDIGRDLAVYVLLDADPALFGLSGEVGTTTAWAGGQVMIDPRHAGIGLRAVGRPEELEAGFAGLGLLPGDPADYEQRRMRLGLPDGSRDMAVEKATLLENGFAELHGVDWQKGCYMGQELTARMKYRGLVKKRLMPFRFDGTLPEGADRIDADGREIAEILSVSGAIGLGLVRLERWRDALLRGSELLIGSVPVTIDQPDWMQLPGEKTDD